MTLTRDPSEPSLEQRLRERERPDRKPVMFQTWQKLLFLHWAWDPVELQACLPPGLFIDTWGGRAWLGVVPFYMRNIRPVWSPSVPGISHFLELNVRTYVYDGEGRPGVWFFSLEASQALAVQLARRFFSLPYHHAKIQAETVDGEVRYYSRRRGAASSSTFAYRGEGPERVADPGSFEFFLVERYLLFAWRAGKQHLFRGRVVHPAYRIRDAVLTEYNTDLFTLNGFQSPHRPADHQLYSEGVDVDVFPLEG